MGYVYPPCHLQMIFGIKYRYKFKEAEKWSFKSKIWKPEISSFVIKKPYFSEIEHISKK